MFDGLFAVSFIFFSLCISALTQLFKAAFDKKLGKYYWYSEQLMPVLPVIIGAVFAACAIHFVFPVGMAALSSRIVYGAVAGLLSSLVYRNVKSYLNSKQEPEDKCPRTPIPPKGP
jgi:hypothetical protein